MRNICLMTLSGSCRTGLARWYHEAVREIVCGMPYAEWKARPQAEATEARKATFTATDPGH